ncbi:ADR190Wp [Eremothecium gossypii ATCC 10895]|uniref:Kynurenine formamidase n=1 Tax=Eremothecium gossypii (strain ATCC 10895 / CBS 109.51 / FGSC 9923 / NRRL Y-1056) TaxID=284811 RepID=KFA_EREGS|nr:ADR190Wp [Eremothecium gossypii ATCC 10895]Q759T3.1 RecName: Full=Kynurenine formamidase; Short=KFA; Short=KFase; AltName: Full=Arylformamidase; AltName: Full=N-formylkynurenine formamidase; Short=FKF [Eremothecium gossypii ATCC 10895]AAS52110.1 ADR190Wp [Eremothecium gossypii ATCC 10895]AEY96409.1 FADR190Wp [Eremothecium gossypii FDAG1]
MQRDYTATEVFQESGPDAIVYLHGGAWIDVRNSPRDFAELAARVREDAPLASQYAVTYRLSPEVQHPVHVADCVEHISQLIVEKGIRKLHLLGHSVGATLCWQILTALPGDRRYPEGPDFAMKLALVRSSLAHVFLVDGIYSLRALLEEYPDYDYFVNKAFKSLKDFEDPSESAERISAGPILHVIHSYKDELLTLKQTQYLTAVLTAHQIPYKLYVDDLGLHEDVYRNEKVAAYIVAQLP